MHETSYGSSCTDKWFKQRIFHAKIKQRLIKCLSELWNSAWNLMKILSCFVLFLIFHMSKHFSHWSRFCWTVQILPYLRSMANLFQVEASWDVKLHCRCLKLLKTFPEIQWWMKVWFSQCFDNHISDKMHPKGNIFALQRDDHVKISLLGMKHAHCRWLIINFLKLCVITLFR